MGAWGIDIFSDDFSCDVRDNYIKQLVKGKSNEEATEIIESQMMPKSDDDLYPLFWIALALTQWKKGRLLLHVKDMAITSINNGSDLTRWETESQLQYNKRKSVLEKAKQELLSPMPPARKIPIPSWMKSDPWHKGDLLSYKITRNDIVQRKYIGKYLLLRVIDMSFYKTNENYLADYAVYTWYGDIIPDLAIINKIDFLKLKEVNKGKSDYSYYISRHILVDKRDIKEHDIKVLINDPLFKPDENELLRNGKKEGGLSGTYRFDYEIVNLLQQYFNNQ